MQFERTGRSGWLAKIAQDSNGLVVSVELVLVAVVLLMGLIVGLSTVRDAVVSEFSDVAGMVDDLNQSFTTNGVRGGSASSAGSAFFDGTDSTGAGIQFDVAPTNEDATSVVVSSVSTYMFTSSGGGPQSGTLGDGTVSTGFTVTTDTGSIGGNQDNEVIFSESAGAPGTFSATFNDPLTDVEFFVSSIANDTPGTPHLLGNFTVTLSDGTVVPNAAFDIVADVIVPNSSYGLFQTKAEDASLITETSIGGISYVQDPLNNGTLNQAAGRIQFSDPAITGAPSNVGISVITFDRSGGSNGYNSRFSVSGRVIQ